MHSSQSPIMARSWARESSDWIGGFQRKLNDLERERDARFPPFHLASLEEFSSIRADFDRKAQKLADDSKGCLGKCHPASVIVQSVLQAAKDRGSNHYRQDLGRPTDNPWGTNDRSSCTKERISCSCCLEDVHISGAISCMAATPHFFCRECPRRHAETLLGMSQFDIRCLSTDGCPYTFSVPERRKFLKAQQARAMDRLEAEDSIRRANLDDLVFCPFCPYAALYPPLEDLTTFTCLNPDCGLSSCRACRLKPHPHTSCEEARRQAGVLGRQTINEEMSEALIRSCNECDTRFVKIAGCNRMTCPRCGNKQCYVCSQTCDSYDHFGADRCPMFDDTEARHRTEVDEAEAKARRRLQLTPGN